MRKQAVLWVGVFLVAGLFTGMTADSSSAEGPIVVQLQPPYDVEGPFPIGWAAINVPKGEVTVLAILPADTVYPGSGENDPNAGKWEFEAWLADLAPPHPCPAPLPTDGTLEEEVSNDEDAFAASDPDITAETSTVPICGSRASSETAFRHFPGLPNRTFQNTYFPASQGLLKQVGPRIGDWALYVGRHKTNMGLRPFDVAGVTVEPPGTGDHLRDYDPRPHPVVALIGRIPHPTTAPGGIDEPNPGDGDGSIEPGDDRPRRRDARPVRIR